MDKKYLYDGEMVGGKKVRGYVLETEGEHFIVPVFGVSCVEDSQHDGWEGDKLITLHAFKVKPDTIRKTFSGGKLYE